MINEIRISPSILSSDFSKLGDEIMKLTEAGADLIHLDVMDGLFVPNITFGAPIIKKLRKTTHLIFDTHLMIQNPEKHIKDFVEAGSDIITIHTEATSDLKGVIAQIKGYGIKAGVSIKPTTNESEIESCLNDVDLILVMTVEPGFGGQKFIHSQLKKISNLRAMIDKSNRDIALQVDGGINEETAKLAIEAGADCLVAGSHIFKDSNYKANIDSLRM